MVSSLWLCCTECPNEVYVPTCYGDVPHILGSSPFSSFSPCSVDAS